MQVDSGGLLGQTVTNQTRLYLIVFCASLAVQVALNFREQKRFFETRPERIYGASRRLLGRFRLPQVNLRWFLGFGILFIVSLVCASANFLPRLFLLIALFCYFPYFSAIMALPSIKRKTNLLPIVLLVLAAAPSISSPLAASSPSWPIFLVKLAVAQMYFSAGVQKLRKGGLRWYDGESMRAYLLTHYLWGDTKRALTLAEHPGICKTLSTLVLLFELTFWLILFFPRLTLIYAVCGIAFHIGNLLTMRINYLRYIGPVYVVFFIDQIAHVQKLLGF